MLAGHNSDTCSDTDVAVAVSLLALIVVVLKACSTVFKRKVP